MHESFISRTQIVAAALWVLVGSLIGSAWLVVAFAPGNWEWAGLLAATGCATSALAAVAHLKVYSVRLCSLIRVTSGLESPSAQVTSLR